MNILPNEEGCDCPNCGCNDKNHDIGDCCGIAMAGGINEYNEFTRSLKMKYRKGQTVRSVAGIFTEGVIEDIIDEDTVKIRWTQHIEQGPIDFVQVRDIDIIKPF